MDYGYCYRCLSGMFHSTYDLPAVDRWLVFSSEEVLLSDVQPPSSKSIGVLPIPKRTFSPGLTGNGWQLLFKRACSLIGQFSTVECPRFVAPDKFTPFTRYVPTNTRKEEPNVKAD